MDVLIKLAGAVSIIGLVVLYFFGNNADPVIPLPDSTLRLEGEVLDVQRFGTVNKLTLQTKEEQDMTYFPWPGENVLPGDEVLITARVSTYQGKQQLIIEEMRRKE